MNWSRTVKASMPLTRIPEALKKEIEKSKYIPHPEQPHMIEEVHPPPTNVRNIRKWPVGALRSTL